jgi:phytoene dehydrogenase-like protein
MSAGSSDGAGARESEGRWDAVVVGAGMGGLGTAALLTDAGLRVLVVEAAKDIGGRAYSFSHRGHVTNVGGPRAGLAGGRVDELFARLGRPSGERASFDGVRHWVDGELVDLTQVAMSAPLDELQSFFAAVEAVTDDDLSALDAIPADQWLEPLARHPALVDTARLAGVVMTTIPRLADMAASSLVESLRIILAMPDIYLAAHGYGDFMAVLASVVTEGHGAVRTRTSVRRVVVEEGTVRGVQVEGRDGTTETLLAPVVVCAFPVWDLFRIADRSWFPASFVEQVVHLEERTAIFGITAALREPLYDGRFFILTDAPRAGYPLSAFMASNVAPSVSPPGEHLLEACCQCDHALGSDKEALAHHIELLRADIDAMFPGWEDQALWVQGSFHWEEPARTAGRAGRFRPDSVAPGISGLYLAGDTVASRALPGLECAADSAMRCAAAITGA